MNPNKIDTGEKNEHKENDGVKSELCNSYVVNHSEYCFEGNTIHMVTLPNSEDFVVGKKKESENERRVQMGRNMKVLSKII